MRRRQKSLPHVGGVAGGMATQVGFKRSPHTRVIGVICYFFR
jgi:hypothetical protein